MILGILQARVSSKRLPGKVLKPILGTPMIFLQIERIGRCRCIDKLVVATSTDPADDVLADACVSRGIAVYRGSLSDVLDRFACAARFYASQAIVRLTADCPLTDWNVIDLAIENFAAGRYDYLSNVDPPTYPDGLDVEVMTHSALIDADRNAQLPSEREHVTTYIRKHPERYRLGSMAQATDLSALRWTVDNIEDFEFVRNVYEALYESNRDFTTDDILALLKVRPELALINSKIERNAGLSQSITADNEWLRHGKIQ